jgi:hypothetical protein
MLRAVERTVADAAGAIGDKTTLDLRAAALGCRVPLTRSSSAPREPRGHRLSTTPSPPISI